MPPSQTNGNKRLVEKERVFFVNVDVRSFMEEIARTAKTGSLKLHFRNGAITKPVLWSEKKPLTEG